MTRRYTSLNAALRSVETLASFGIGSTLALIPATGDPFAPDGVEYSVVPLIPTLEFHHA